MTPARVPGRGQRRQPAGAGVVVAVAIGMALVAAACGHGSSDEDAGGKVLPTMGSSAETTVFSAPTTTVVAGSAGGPAASPTSRPAAPGGAAGRAPGRGSSNQVGAGAALAPAPAGTYHYTTTGASTFGLTTVPFPAVSTLTVDPPSGTHQHSTRDLRNAQGAGPLIEYSLDYRPEGIFVEALKLTTSAQGFTNAQDLRPPAPVLLLPTGGGPGNHQEFDVSGGGSTAHLVLDVSRAERVTIAGQSVDTLVMRLTASLPPGDVSGQLDLTAWFSPSSRLFVKEHFVSDATAGGGLFRFHSQYDATLQRSP